MKDDCIFCKIVKDMFALCVLIDAMTIYNQRYIQRHPFYNI